MRKAFGICNFKLSVSNTAHYDIYAFSLVLRNGVNIDFDQCRHQTFSSLDDMIYYLVEVAKANNFEIPYYDDCGQRLFDIACTDIDRPYEILKWFVDKRVVFSHSERA